MTLMLRSVYALLGLSRNHLDMYFYLCYNATVFCHSCIVGILSQTDTK
jgi:hypothetical protein